MQMNPSVTTLAAPETRIIQQHHHHAAASTKPSMGILLLAVIVLLSALAVVYVTDLNRRVFIQLQQAQTMQTQLHSDWGKLLLEQSTWSTQARIQSLAQQRLGMTTPASSNIVMIKLNQV